MYMKKKLHKVNNTILPPQNCGLKSIDHKNNDTGRFLDTMSTPNLTLAI